MRWHVFNAPYALAMSRIDALRNIDLKHKANAVTGALSYATNGGRRPRLWLLDVGSLVEVSREDVVQWSSSALEQGRHRQ